MIKWVSKIKNAVQHQEQLEERAAREEAIKHLSNKIKSFDSQKTKLKNDIKFDEIKDCKTLIERQQKVEAIIIDKVEKGTGTTLPDLKKEYSDQRLFIEALKHVTTTSRALCEALKIHSPSACRYKRWNDNYILRESKTQVQCPWSGYKAKLLSTDPNEFEGLDNNDQLSLF